MNRHDDRRKPVLFILALLLAGVAMATVPAQDKSPSYAEGEIMVKFKAGTTFGAAAILASDVDAAPVREFRLLSESRRRPYLLLRSTRHSTAELLAALRDRPEVEAVSPNYRRRLLRQPNDPKFAKLWGMVKIGAPQAWEHSVGSRDVVIAVLDTGVDYRHPDLVANMWRNPGEIPGNGVDDDSNGFKDDVYGFDFAASALGGNDSDPMDIDSHGTHVAGTIAAVGDNETGVCGVNWQARIMALKGFRPDLHIYDSDCIEAIEYAVMMKRDRGVNLVAINASFGGSGSNALQEDAIAEAGENGIIFVCAAGNDGTDNDASAFFPSGYALPSIIAVAASDKSDALASFSNFGKNSVDLAAPGAGIFSTVPTGKGQEAWLRSGADTFDANPMEYSGLTAASGLSRNIYDCGRGLSASTFPAGVRGNIALIERGDISFEQKTVNAQTAGAVGVAIYNNEGGGFSGTLGRAGSWVPVVSLSREDGLQLRVRGTHMVNLTNRAGDYGLMDGTSMAAPHVSGALGLLAARFPADDMTKRITRLYSGAERLAGLEGKVRLGARLNIGRALSQWVVVSMAVSRLQASAWVIEKDYAEVHFTVDKDAGSGISGETYTVYRKTYGGAYQAIREIAAAELQNGAFTLYDKFLERGTAYVYVVQAESSQGEVLALSNEQSI